MEKDLKTIKKSLKRKALVWTIAGIAGTTMFLTGIALYPEYVLAGLGVVMLLIALRGIYYAIVETLTLIEERKRNSIEHPTVTYVQEQHGGSDLPLRAVKKGKQKKYIWHEIEEKKEEKGA